MGTVDNNRIVEVREDPPCVILEIGERLERRTFELSGQTAEALLRVSTEQPFGNSQAGEYSYWIRTIEHTEGRDWIFFRRKRRNFKIGVRIKRGTSRSLVMLPCTAYEYDALGNLFPLDGFDA